MGLLRLFPAEMQQIACVPECPSCAEAAEEVLHSRAAEQGCVVAGAALLPQLCSCSLRVPGWLRLCAGLADAPGRNSGLQEVFPGDSNPVVLSPGACELPAELCGHSLGQELTAGRPLCLSGVTVRLEK